MVDQGSVWKGARDEVREGGRKIAYLRAHEVAQKFEIMKSNILLFPHRCARIARVTGDDVALKDMVNDAGAGGLMKPTEDLEDWNISDYNLREEKMLCANWVRRFRSEASQSQVTKTTKREHEEGNDTKPPDVYMQSLKTNSAKVEDWWCS